MLPGRSALPSTPWPWQDQLLSHGAPCLSGSAIQAAPCTQSSWVRGGSSTSRESTSPGGPDRTLGRAQLFTLSCPSGAVGSRCREPGAARGPQPITGPTGQMPPGGSRTSLGKRKGGAGGRDTAGPGSSQVGKGRQQWPCAQPRAPRRCLIIWLPGRVPARPVATAPQLCTDPDGGSGPQQVVPTAEPLPRDSMSAPHLGANASLMRGTLALQGSGVSVCLCAPVSLCPRPCQPVCLCVSCRVSVCICVRFCVCVPRLCCERNTVHARHSAQPRSGRGHMGSDFPAADQPSLLRLCLHVPQFLVQLQPGPFQRWLNLECVTDAWCNARLKGTGIKGVSASHPQ